MKLLKKLQNRHFYAGVQHGRIIGIQAVEALLHSEIKALLRASKDYPDLKPRVNELQFVLAKVKRLYVK